MYAGAAATQLHGLQHPDELDGYPLVVGKPASSGNLVHQGSGEALDYRPSGNVRLAERAPDIAIEKSGRGRFRLNLKRPLSLIQEAQAR